MSQALLRRRRSILSSSKPTRFDEGPLAHPAGTRELGEGEAVGVPGVNDVLDPVHGVADVRAVPEHDAGLRFFAVAAGEDDHLAGDAGGEAGPVAQREQMQGEVDMARVTELRVGVRRPSRPRAPRRS